MENLAAFYHADKTANRFKTQIRHAAEAEVFILLHL